MNPFGPFGNMMPYSNFHGMNLDWVIQIAKDFLDQYTHIQETIDTGLDDLDAKATELEGLLQQWYDTHSQDIADQLTQAIADFQAAAQEIGSTVIASIPADYTALSNTVTGLTQTTFKASGIISTENKQAVCSGDCNNIASNTYYEVAADAALTNQPVNNLRYSIATFGKFSNRTAGDLQIAVVNSTSRFYFRIYVNEESGWQNWTEIAYKSEITSINSTLVKTFKASGVIDATNKQAVCSGDCNNIASNTYYEVAANATLTNQPVNNLRYSIATFGKFADRTAGDLQIAVVNSTSRYYYRIYINADGGWQNWVELASRTYVNDKVNMCFKGSNITITADNKQSICQGDCDNLSNNNFYGVTTGTNLSNNPPVDNSVYAYTIGTFGKYADRTAGDIQFAGHNHLDKLYYRIFESIPAGWSKWHPIQNAITDESVYSGITMFEKFGVIGDSFASGPFSSSGPNYNLSWGQDLARETGTECINYSIGGVGTYGFLNSEESEYNTRLNGKLLADINGNNKCGLYFLCMGLNDSNSTKTFGDKHGGLDYLGSSADINQSDYTQNANSFWGNYGRIIAEITELNPNARIVMCTYCRINTGEPYAYDAYNTAIQEIAEFFNIPCIVLTDDTFFESPFYLNHLVNNHPSSLQYVGYAKAVDRLLSRCMVNNFDYFRVYMKLPV